MPDASDIIAQAYDEDMIGLMTMSLSESRMPARATRDIVTLLRHTSPALNDADAVQYGSIRKAIYRRRSATSADTVPS